MLMGMLPASFRPFPASLPETSPDAPCHARNDESARMIWLAVLMLGLVSGTLSGIVGFGASIMLMPVLMLAVGPHEAVPIMAIAALLANLARVMVWWREVDWRANAYYCITAVPCAALGARTLLTLNAHIVEGILGALFICMIPARRWLLAQ